MSAKAPTSSASCPEPAPTGLLGTFPRTFWVANVMELFERGAYYGMNALLAIYLTDKTGGALGFSEDKAGLLQSIVYAITYVLPILGGALADRYGYRRTLMVAFSLMAAGYFLTSQVTSYWVIMATLGLMAVGSGLFKPIISGTIARTTTERTSGFGFGVYYWMINIGALFAPFFAGFLRGRFDWRWVFFASSAYCALMLLPTVFLYRDPPLPENRKSLRTVLGDALTVLSDARFMLLVLVYSCYWILYFQGFTTLLWFLRDFVDPEPMNRLFAWVGLHRKFDAEFVTMINAATIVLLQVVVSAIVKNVRPLPTMVAGILLGSAGYAFLAFSPSVWLFVTAIVISSIGEMTCHPKYISYIGIVAPPDKKAVYMGYAFLYGVVGSLIGVNVGAEAYYRVVKPIVGHPDAMSTIRPFWSAFAVLGALTAVGLLAYDRFFREDTSATRAHAKRLLTAVYAVLVVAAPALVLLVNRSGAVPPKTWIQSGIMFALGAFGLQRILRRKTAPATKQ